MQNTRGSRFAHARNIVQPILQVLKKLKKILCFAHLFVTSHNN